MAYHPTPPIENLQAALNAATAHGSKEAGACALGIPPSTFRRYHAAAIKAGLKAGVQRLISVESAAAPAGYTLKGTSTYFNKDGVPVGQWVKTTKDQLAFEAMQKAAWDALSQSLAPIKEIKRPRRCIADLLNLVTITDSHVGMLAWDKETGADWDLVIAERVLTETFLQMIAAAPRAATCIVNQLGDFLHFDSLQPLTPTNHHVLDADSRYQKVVEVAVRILRRIISAALETHEHVQVYMHEGNHDPAGSVWLRIMFAQLYGNNPRVTVGKSPNPYVAYQHGKNFIGFHHGHLSKKERLPLLFAASFPEMWGETKFRVVHTGHLHNVVEQEHAGINIMQHATLAAPDAYAARSGYLSKRQATLHTYHKELGEVSRQIFVPTK